MKSISLCVAIAAFAVPISFGLYRRSQLKTRWHQMRGTLTVVFLLSGGSLMAGSITISATDDVQLSVPAVPGSLIGDYRGSASGPTNLTQPLILTATSNLNAPSPPPPGQAFISQGSAQLSTTPSAPMSAYYLFPSIFINFAPAGWTGGDASVSSGQVTGVVGTLGPTDQLFFNADINGTSAATFILDPVANVMTLNVSSQASGFVYLSGSFYDTRISPTLTTLLSINYTFVNGIVTASSNSLGLSLPGVGDAADFSVSHIGPFQVTLPALSTVDYPTLRTLNYVDVEGLTITPAPEPSTLMMLGVPLAVLAVRRLLPPTT